MSFIFLQPCKSGIDCAVLYIICFFVIFDESSRLAAPNTILNVIFLFVQFRNKGFPEYGTILYIVVSVFVFYKGSCSADSTIFYKVVFIFVFYKSFVVALNAVFEIS